MMSTLKSTPTSTLGLVFSLAALLGTSGCASSGSGASGRAAVSQMAIGDGQVETYRQVEESEQVVDAPESEIWPHLPAIFDELGVEVTEVKEQQRIIGNPRFKPGRIEGERLSTYLECGRDHGGPYADQHEVWVTFMVQLLRDPSGGTRVATLLNGFARPRNVSGNDLPCTSKLVLEARLVELINARLGEADTSTQSR